MSTSLKPRRAFSRAAWAANHSDSSSACTMSAPPNACSGLQHAVAQRERQRVARQAAGKQVAQRPHAAAGKVEAGEVVARAAGLHHPTSKRPASRSHGRRPQTVGWCPRTSRTRGRGGGMRANASTAETGRLAYARCSTALRRTARNRALTAADTWERHLVVAELAGSPRTVIDVGGLPGQLADFLPGASVVAVNIAPPADLARRAGRAAVPRPLDRRRDQPRRSRARPPGRAGGVRRRAGARGRGSGSCSAVRSAPPSTLAAEAEIQDWHREADRRRSPVAGRAPRARAADRRRARGRPARRRRPRRSACGCASTATSASPTSSSARSSPPAAARARAPSGRSRAAASPTGPTSTLTDAADAIHQPRLRDRRAGLTRAVDPRRGRRRGRVTATPANCGCGRRAAVSVGAAATSALRGRSSRTRQNAITLSSARVIAVGVRAYRHTRARWITPRRTRCARVHAGPTARRWRRPGAAPACPAAVRAGRHRLWRHAQPPESRSPSRVTSFAVRCAPPPPRSGRPTARATTAPTQPQFDRRQRLAVDGQRLRRRGAPAEPRRPRSPRRAVGAPARPAIGRRRPTPATAGRGRRRQSPATSRSTGRSEQATGTPRAIASSTGRPKPSASVVVASALAAA